MRALFTALLTGLALAVYAQTTTLAWRATFTPDDSWIPCTVASDANNNAYVLGTDPAQANYTLHLHKYDGTGRQLFAVDLPLTATWSYFSPAPAIFSSPAINGQQYLYVIYTVAPETAQSPVLAYLRVAKFSTSGQLQWSTLIQNDVGYWPDLCGSYFDGQGNALLAISDAGVPMAHTLRMVTLDPDGNLTSDHSNNSIYVQYPVVSSGSDPLDGLFAHSAFYHPAVYDPARARWIAEGEQTVPTGSYRAVRWGIYDPATGKEDYHETVATVESTTYPRFTINLLPNGYVAVATSYVYLVSNPSPMAYQLKVLNPDNSELWHAPASGLLNGIALQTYTAGPSAPIYLSGTTSIGFSTGLPQFLDQFDWTGQHVLHLDHQPAEAMFPAQVGFNSLCFFPYEPSLTGGLDVNASRYFIEHFDGAIWDWGVKFQDFPIADPGFPLGYAGSADSFYAVTRVENINEAVPPFWWIYVDRYVQGTFVGSVTSPASVQQNKSVPVTVAINTPAGKYGYPFGLYSNSAKLLMPNGTRSQNFRIPALQKSLTISLTAGSVSTNTTVTLLATQNGVKRTSATTITP